MSDFTTASWPFDGAAKGLGLGHRRSLACENGVECVLQRSFRDALDRTGIVDRAVVGDLTCLVEDEDFRRDLGGKAVGQFVVVVLVDGEGETVVLGVLHDFGRRLGRVRVGEDEVDALRLVFAVQVLHSAVVVVGDGALGRNEDQRGGLAFDRDGNWFAVRTGKQQRFGGGEKRRASGEGEYCLPE